MRMVATRTLTLLLACALFGLSACLQEHSVVVKKDGQVSFETIVTEEDKLQKLELAQFEQVINNAVDQLKEHHWKTTVTWISKERPYQVKIGGTGKLDEVAGKTTLYELASAPDKKFNVAFLVPANSDVRVLFSAPDEGVRFLDAAGKPVQTVEGVSSREIFTIALP